MTSNTILLIGVFVLVVFVIIFLALPPESSRRKKKARVITVASPEDKKWEEAIAKLEKHIGTLHQDIEKMKAQEKKYLRELALEKEKNSRLQEKISQEKGWLTKQQESQDKKDELLREIRETLQKTENNFEKEYSEKLKTERQLKETRQELDVSSKEKLSMTLKIQRLELDLDNFRKEASKYKKSYEDLSRKNEQTDWVAKAEYDKLLVLLKEKQKEIERISRNQ